MNEPVDVKRVFWSMLRFSEDNRGRTLPSDAGSASSGLAPATVKALLANKKAKASNWGRLVQLWNHKRQGLNETLWSCRRVVFQVHHRGAVQNLVPALRLCQSFMGLLSSGKSPARFHARWCSA